MKKIQLVIFGAIIVTVVSSLFLNKKTPETQVIEEGIDEKNHNPGAEKTLVLGETIDEENSIEPKIKVVSQNTKPASETTEPTNKNKVIFEKNKLYSLINSHRKDLGLSPLNINQSLEISAKRKIEDMIENNYFRHEDTGNVESWYLFKTAGYEYKTAGENLSSGINTPWQVFEAWMNSQIHNEQLTNGTYMDMGVSADCESYKIASEPSCIVVLHLGSK